MTLLLLVCDACHALSDAKMVEEFDHIIVGSGSAGSVMAHRLSEAGRTVLVLEYGGTDLGPLIQMPSAL
jgi:choline dehydrogenase